MAPPKITNDATPTPVEIAEPHSAAATVTATVDRLGEDDVRTRVDFVAEFGEAVSRFTGIFGDLDAMLQNLPTNVGDIRGGILRFAERAGDAIANFTKSLEGDLDIGPCDMDQDGPYYRILADWALHTKAIDQELHADITHINGREVQLPDFSFGTLNDDADADIDSDTGDDTAIG